jgi:hypothetical protein
MSLAGILTLSIYLLLNELEKVVLRHIFEVITVSAGRVHKPLKDLLKSVLTPLLISNIVAESGLLIELS